MRPQLFRTRITELLGIDHPILCGGLGPGVSDGRYVAAAVNAGGMGFIVSLGYDDPDEFFEQMRICRELTNGRKFGVNLYMSRQSGAYERVKALVPALADAGVGVVETAGASPEALIPQLHEAGIKVLHKVPAVKYARTAERIGADGVIVVGAECGGHPGTFMIGTMVQAAHAPSAVHIPVVIGGGIGTGRQLAAVLGMGGEGVLMGTAAMMAEELWIHPNYKAGLAAADGTESTVIKKILRDHHRVLDNDTAKAVLQLEAEGVTDFKAYQALVSGGVTRNGYKSGDTTWGTYDWGQSAIFADAVKPMDAIFDMMLDDAVAALQRLQAVSAMATA